MEKTSKSFKKVHIDFLGTFHHYVRLILVDSFSRLPFVTKRNNITSPQTILGVK